MFTSEAAQRWYEGTRLKIKSRAIPWSQLSESDRRRVHHWDKDVNLEAAVRKVLTARARRARQGPARLGSDGRGEARRGPGGH